MPNAATMSGMLAANVNAASLSTNNAATAGGTLSLHALTLHTRTAICSNNQQRYICTSSCSCSAQVAHRTPRVQAIEQIVHLLTPLVAVHAEQHLMSNNEHLYRSA